MKHPAATESNAITIIVLFMTSPLVIKLAYIEILRNYYRISILDHDILRKIFAFNKFFIIKGKHFILAGTSPYYDNLILLGPFSQAACLGNGLQEVNRRINGKWRRGCLYCPPCNRPGCCLL